MSGNDVREKVHSELGASIAGRWMACPGSVRLARTLPTPPTTEYAQEGTRAHAVAELALRNGVEPHALVSATLEGGEVTDDMADAVKVFTDFCRQYMQPSFQPTYAVEQRFSLAALNPPAPMFGTADFVAYNADVRELHIVDLKYGRGVVVEAIGNKQLRYYALGALLTQPKGTVVDDVYMTIVQPRALHPDGPIRTESIPVEELLAFATELLDAARATAEPDAPLVAGRWCQFCPAGGICPAQRAHAESVAMVEFANLPLDKPQDPTTLTPAQLGNLLKVLPIVEDWAEAVRGAAYAKLERGEEVPGMKLVAKRATRKWSAPQEAEALLRAARGGDDFMTEPELKSPAQVEKLIGKRNFGAFSDFVAKVSSGYNMVPEHDSRPAVILTPGSEFPLLPGGTGSVDTTGE